MSPCTDPQWALILPQHSHGSSSITIEKDATQDHETLVSDLPSVTTPKNLHVNNLLPNEILNEIFRTIMHEYLSYQPSSFMGCRYHGHSNKESCLKADRALADAICFGLACKRFWSIFKAFHPYGLKLYTFHDINGKLKDAGLAGRLRHWMTPKYRLSAFAPTHDTSRTVRRPYMTPGPVDKLPFLSCEIYGSWENPNIVKERALQARYNLYRGPSYPNVYPNPFRIDARTWCLAAAQALQQTSEKCDFPYHSGICINTWLDDHPDEVWNYYLDSSLRNWVETREEARLYKEKLGISVSCGEHVKEHREMGKMHFCENSDHHLAMLKLIPDEEADEV